MGNGREKRPGPNVLTYFSHYLTFKEQLALLVIVTLGIVGTVLYFGAGSAVSPPVEENGPGLRAAEGEASPPEFDIEPQPGEDPARDPAEPSALEPAGSESAAEVHDERIYVAVQGAVRLTGTHEMEADARVGDLLDRARLREDVADISELNLAAPLIDGTTLIIPYRSEASVNGDRLVVRRGRSAREMNPEPYTLGGWRPSASAEGGERDAAPASTPSRPGLGSGEDGPLDLNSASQSELETLPGIGPVYAKAIIEFRQNRPFTQVEEVTFVHGIGPKRLESIREHVTVIPP